MMTVETISAQQLHNRVESGTQVELIDVRTPAEYREVHVPFAKNVPLDQLNPAAIAASRTTMGEPLYVICRSGSRAGQACDKLISAGYAQVINVEGGTQAWDQAGLPVVRGKKTISLERQVRIAAGLLVLVGSVLGAFMHPAFIGLAGFVGAGLMFAGITDTCGMGMMLARMPWNQVKATTGGQTCSTSTKTSCCG